jgi:hypothetical protein
VVNPAARKTSTADEVVTDVLEAVLPGFTGVLLHRIKQRNSACAAVSLSLDHLLRLASALKSHQRPREPSK